MIERSKVKSLIRSNSENPLKNDQKIDAECPPKVEITAKCDIQRKLSMFEPKSVVEFVLDDTNFTKNDRDKTLLLDENEALKKHPSASKIVQKGVKKVALVL